MKIISFKKDINKNKPQLQTVNLVHQDISN